MMHLKIFRQENIAHDLKADQHFAKTMVARDLLVLGIGAVIGTGIFILPGTVAAKTAGPGVTLSFFFAAIVCALAAMCYAEFSSAIPVAGGAYSYGNIIFGEVIGWFLGWALILEYILALSSVSTGWAAYFNAMMSSFGVNLPKALTGPFSPQNGTYFNLVAALIVLLIAFMLRQGMKTSMTISSAAVVIKLAIILIFIVVGVAFIKPNNYHPFMPYHFSGVIRGSATVFFAFLGFDAVSSSAAEVKNPKHNMPIGIIGTLVVATLLYMGVSFVLTGMVNYRQLNVANPVAFALRLAHQTWLANLLSLGALIGMFTMMVTVLYSASRLIYSISRDGLLPKKLCRFDERSHTPKGALWFVAIVGALLGGLGSLDELTSLVNIGTLLAFICVSFGILRLRKRKDIPNSNGFQVPGYPILPIISGILCTIMLFLLPKSAFIGAGIWFAIGLLIYACYGYKHSRLQQDQR